MYDNYCICLAIFLIQMWVCQTSGCKNSFWRFLSWNGVLDAREVLSCVEVRKCGKIARISTKNLGFLPTPPPRVYSQLRWPTLSKSKSLGALLILKNFREVKMLQDEAVVSTNDDATSCKRYNMYEIQQKISPFRHWCAKTFSLTFVRFSVLDRK